MFHGHKGESPKEPTKEHQRPQYSFLLPRMETLTFVMKERLGSITDIKQGKTLTDEGDLSHIFNWIKFNWTLVILAVLILLLGIIILVWNLLPPLVIVCSEKIQEV